MNTYKHLCQPACREIQTRLFVTTEPWGCEWEYDGKKRYMHVPVGVIWDGASIPRAGWSVLGLTPSGEMSGPSLAHDMPYRSRGGIDIDKLQGTRIVNSNGNRVQITRKEADWVIQAAMGLEGINKLKRRIVYSIVRVFGRRHWGGPMPYNGHRGA